MYQLEFPNSLLSDVSGTGSTASLQDYQTWRPFHGYTFSLAYSKPLNVDERARIAHELRRIR